MKKNNKNPNILFIMTDQLRFDYLNCAGAEFLNTPNIDRIAKNGIRFSNCFTNAPQCAPARIGLALGKQPCRVGALDNMSYLPLNAHTYYKQLRDFGYKVGCVGKLDIAKPSEYNGVNGDRPCLYSYGFTSTLECEGKEHAAKGKYPLGPYGNYLKKRGLFEKFCDDYMKRKEKNRVIRGYSDSVLPTEDFEDSYIGRQACKWIRENPDDFPWHLFVSFVGPHNPFDPPKEFADKYRNVEMPKAVKCNLDEKPNYIRNRYLDLNDEEVAKVRRQYCAAIELIDCQVGLIIDELEKKGEMDNTYIIFASDHGEMLGDFDLYTKIVPYEPSIHVPLIVSGPGINKGDVSNAMIELIDINPTICELAKVPVRKEMDAKSFGDVLFRKSLEHREDIVTRVQQYRCIRTKKYKFIQNYNQKNELYDLENDPHELNNIVDKNEKLEKQFMRRLIERYEEGEGLW